MFQIDQFSVCENGSILNTAWLCPQKRSKRDGTRNGVVPLHPHNSKGAPGFTVLQSDNSTPIRLSIPIRRVRYVPPECAGSHRETNETSLPTKDQRTNDNRINDNRIEDQPHRPEFYIPRMTRRHL
jgi:hypothetical protein